MWRTQIRDEESKIEAEKRIKYKGTARIRLKWLHFQKLRKTRYSDVDGAEDVSESQLRRQNHQIQQGQDFGSGL